MRLTHIVRGALCDTPCRDVVGWSLPGITFMGYSSLLRPSLPFPSSSSLPSNPPLSLALNPAREFGQQCKLPQLVRAEPGDKRFFGKFSA